MEIILNEFDWHVNDRTTNNGKRTLCLSAIALSTVYGISQAITNKSYILTSLGFFPLIAETVMIAFDRCMDMRFKNAIKSLIENLRKLHQMNRSIQDYLETREFVRYHINKII